MSSHKATTLFVGPDSHEDSISVAYAQEGCADPPVFVGSIGTRRADIDSLARRLHPKARRFVTGGPPQLADCVSSASLCLTRTTPTRDKNRQFVRRPLSQRA